MPLLTLASELAAVSRSAGAAGQFQLVDHHVARRRARLRRRRARTRTAPCRPSSGRCASAAPGAIAAGELRLRRRARSLRRDHRHRPLGDHLAFGIAGRGLHAQARDRLVGLVGIELQLAELGRRAEAQRQHAGRQRIERAGVARLLGAQQPLGTSAARGCWRDPAACRAATPHAQGAAAPWCVARSWLVFFGTGGDGLGDQGVHVGGALGGAVELEVQRRHGVDVQALEQAVAQEAGRLVERFLRSSGSPTSTLKKTLACA